MKSKIAPLYVSVLVFCLNVGFSNGQTDKVVTKKATIENNNDIQVYNFDQLEPLLYTKSNKTIIVNFWAMWCAPCLKELPYLHPYVTNNPEVELLLVSMDFPKDIEAKLKPFLKKNNISAKVVLLDDPDANTWIDKIDPNWSGALPFTIIFNNKNRAYHERTFESVEELKNEVNKIIK